MGGVMNDRVTAWSQIRVLTCPGIVGIGVPNVDERGILVPVTVLGFFWVSQEVERVAVGLMLIFFFFLTVFLSYSLLILPVWSLPPSRAARRGPPTGPRLLAPSAPRGSPGFVA